jgi:hypothetical protein
MTEELQWRLRVRGSEVELWGWRKGKLKGEFGINKRSDGEGRMTWWEMLQE